MGDRCWIEITFREKDEDKIKEILGDFWDEVEVDNGVVTAIAYEANYGLFDEREEFAKAGLTFYGNHGAGNNYGDIAFACHKGKHAEINADFNSGPVVAMNIETGEISKTNLDIFYNYRRVYLDAKEFIEGK